MKDITTEEAVKILKHWEITISACDIPDGNYRFQKSIEKILNELEKKDKIIDAMVEQLAGLTIWNEKKDEPLMLMTKEDVVQFFEKEVKDE